MDFVSIWTKNTPNACKQCFFVPLRIKKSFYFSCMCLHCKHYNYDEKYLKVVLMSPPFSFRNVIALALQRSIV